MSHYQHPPFDRYSPQSSSASYLPGDKQQPVGQFAARGSSLAQHTPSPQTTEAQNPPLFNPFGPPQSPSLQALPSLSQETAGQAEQQQRPLQPLLDDRPVVAFVRGITGELEDKCVLEILQACGAVNSWRRACDSDDSPLGFGFCEFKSIHGVLCAMAVLPKVDWACQSERERSLSRPTSLSVTVDKTVQMALDRHSAGSDHPASTNKTTIQTTLDAINCILLECGILKNLGADAQRSDKRVEETEATASSAAGDTLDHSTGLNLDNLSIANETALDTRDGMPDIEQQSPFQLSQEEEWEREQVMSHRNRRYILAAKDLEGRLVREQEVRERRAEHNALRELDRVEERQRASDLMSAMLCKWDDSKEERLLAHGYYRNRERWWHNRQVARTKELELDEIDRQEQTLCREQRASKVPSPDASATETTATITEHSCSATKVHTQRLSPIYRPNTNNGSQSPTKALVQESQPSVDSLFAQPVQWDYVDATLLQAEVEPVVKMLLLEYLGGDADDGSVADLVEFVIGHLRDHKSPQSLVEELEMVLVDEAPAFVAQIWRVLLSTAEPNALPQS